MSSNWLSFSSMVNSTRNVAHKIQGNYMSLQPSGSYMYRQSNIQQFYVLPTQRIYVFCVDLRTNSDYFTIRY